MFIFRLIVVAASNSSSVAIVAPVKQRNTIAPPKGVERAQIKIDTKYDGDPTQIPDILR